MKQMIPIEKQSKKAQREFYSQHRGSWNGVNPVTKTVPDKKKYNRTRDIKAYLTPKKFGC